MKQHIFSFALCLMLLVTATLTSCTDQSVQDDPVKTEFTSPSDVCCDLVAPETINIVPEFDVEYEFTQSFDQEDQTKELTAVLENVDYFDLMHETELIDHTTKLNDRYSQNWNKALNPPDTKLGSSYLRSSYPPLV